MRNIFSKFLIEISFCCFFQKPTKVQTPKLYDYCKKLLKVKIETFQVITFLI